MLQAFQRLRRERSESKRFHKLSHADRAIVFYSEGPHDWPHISPVIQHLTTELGRSVCVLTSVAEDPVMTLDNANVHSFCIGSGIIRTILFRTIRASVFVMTMPDLETFHLKRSLHPAHYVYVFHSINSTHMVYRKGAFDAYDTILCVGPHHIDEIRRTEEVYGLKEKTLRKHGYGRLDAVIGQTWDTQKPDPAAGRRVVLAPTWGESSFIENEMGEKIIQTILAAGYQVALRLHPMTVRRLPGLVGHLAARFPSREDFTIVTDMTEQRSIHDAQIMLSDWSGAAFEFAYARERPVLFVNTPPKINNPEYGRVELPPLESAVRNEIGDILEPHRLHEVVEKIEALSADPRVFRDRIRESYIKWIFNPGTSGRVGAEIIAEQADRIGTIDEEAQNHTAARTRIRS